MSNEEAVYYLELLRINLQANSFFDIALVKAIEAVKKAESEQPITINAVFHCYNCGWKWLINITECEKKRHRNYGHLLYVCKCPECDTENVTTQTTNRQGKEV